MIQRFINSRLSPHETPVKLVDPSNREYRDLHNVLERRYRELHEKGVGTSRRQAEVISVEEEEALWRNRALGTESPLSLLNAVFFYNGMYFVLRGGEEHRGLTLSRPRTCIHVLSFNRWKL